MEMNSEDFIRTTKLMKFYSGQAMICLTVLQRIIIVKHQKVEIHKCNKHCRWGFGNLKEI
jgi:hypothetical protein